jgi:hypothetical protein
MYTTWKVGLETDIGKVLPEHLLDKLGANIIPHNEVRVGQSNIYG